MKGGSKMFVNFAIRIKRYEKGYAVEVRVKRALFGSKWVNIVSYAGLRESPFYYSTHEGAKTNVLKMIEYELS